MEVMSRSFDKNRKARPIPAPQTDLRIKIDEALNRGIRNDLEMIFRLILSAILAPADFSSIRSCGLGDGKWSATTLLPAMC